MKQKNTPPKDKIMHVTKKAIIFKINVHKI